MFPLCAEHISLGALGDSFYEYLLKSWLMTSKHDVEARDMYFESISAIMNKLVRHTPNGLTYITDMKNGRPDSKMQHLVSHLTIRHLSENIRTDQTSLCEIKVHS